MIKILLLTGQAEAGSFIANVLLGAFGVLLLVIGLGMAESRVPRRDLRLTFLVAAGLSQLFVLVRLHSDRAYELKYSTYNGSWIGDWVNVMIAGSTSRAPSGSIAGINACLLPWALMVLCLAVAQRWGRPG